jgi:hypothetical protein
MMMKNRWESFFSIGCLQYCVCNDLDKIIQWIIHQHLHQMHLKEKQQIFKMLNSEKGKCFLINYQLSSSSSSSWFMSEEKQRHEMTEFNPINIQICDISVIIQFPISHHPCLDVFSSFLSICSFSNSLLSHSFLFHSIYHIEH